MSKIDHLRDAWSSLGIAFNFKSDTQYDPETALVDLIKSNEFPDDKKMMGLALLWLNEFSKLVHVERLKSLSKTLNPRELAILGGVASKCVKLGDFRWRLIMKLAKIETEGKVFEGDSELFIEMKGLDEDFSKFGLRVATMGPDSNKKLLPRKIIVKNNAWLRNRLLFGPNVRADVATVKALNLADTGYKAAKILNCSANAAYRNWNDLDEAGWMKDSP